MKVISNLLTESLDVDESAAGTFTEIEIDLPTSAIEGIGIVILGVDIISDSGADTTATGARLTGDVCLSKKEKTAMPEMDDEDVIAFKRCIWTIDTTATQAYALQHFQEGGYCGKFVENIELGEVILDGTIFAYVDSDNTGVVYTSDMRINYVMVDVNKEELIQELVTEVYANE